MTSRIWNGSTADIRTAADWTPAGMPQAGDTGVVTQGEVLANRLTLDGFTLLLRGSGHAAPPTLGLTDATLGTGFKLHVAASELGGSSPEGRIEAGGTDTVAGQVVVGSAASPATLDVQLAAPTAELVNTGTMIAEPGSTIAIESGQLVNGGRMFALGGTLDLNTEVTGAGSILIGRSGTGAGGVVDAEQIVGSGQSVLMHGGILELGQPHFFLGTIRGWDSGSSIDLLHTHVTGLDFANGVLTVHDGMFTEAQLRVAGSYGDGSGFHFRNTAAGNAILTTTAHGPWS